MNKEIMDIFIEAVGYATGKGKAIEKGELVALASELNIDFKPRESKEKIIKKIVEAGKEQELYERFKDRYLLPYWVIYKYFGLNYEKWEALKKLGVVECETGTKVEYDKEYKRDCEVPVYKIEVLEKYEKEYLQEEYNKAYNQKGYRVRVEVESEEDAEHIENELAKVFRVSSRTDYEHRNEDGYYSYFYIKELNENEQQTNALLVEIEELKKRIEKQRKEHKEELERRCDFLNQKAENQRKWKNEAKKRVEELEKEIQELKNEQNIKAESEQVQELKNEIQNVYKQFGAKDRVEYLYTSVDLASFGPTVKELIEKYSKCKKENQELKKEAEEKEKLKDEVQKLKNERKKIISECKKKKGVQELKNERGAGRKSKFSSKQIEQILEARRKRKSIRKIAKEFNCSVGLVHKIINEQNEQNEQKEEK